MTLEDFLTEALNETGRQLLASQAELAQARAERDAARARVGELQVALRDALDWLLNTDAGRAVPQIKGQPGEWMRRARAALAGAAPGGARGEKSE